MLITAIQFIFCFLSIKIDMSINIALIFTVLGVDTCLAPCHLVSPMMVWPFYLEYPVLDGLSCDVAMGRTGSQDRSQAEGRSSY